MDFPLQTDIIYLDISIVYIKGSPVVISELYCIFSLKIVLVIARNGDPDGISHHVAFYLGLYCLPKYPFNGFQICVITLCKFL